MQRGPICLITQDVPDGLTGSFICNRLFTYKTVLFWPSVSVPESESEGGGEGSMSMSETRIYVPATVPVPTYTNIKTKSKMANSKDSNDSKDSKANMNNTIDMRRMEGGGDGGTTGIVNGSNNRSKTKENETKTKENGEGAEIIIEYKDNNATSSSSSTSSAVSTIFDNFERLPRGTDPNTTPALTWRISSRGSCFIGVCCTYVCVNTAIRQSCLLILNHV